MKGPLQVIAESLRGLHNYSLKLQLLRNFVRHSTLSTQLVLQKWLENTTRQLLHIYIYILYNACIILDRTTRTIPFSYRVQTFVSWHVQAISSFKFSNFLSNMSFSFKSSTTVIKPRTKKTLSKFGQACYPLMHGCKIQFMSLFY